MNKFIKIFKDNSFFLILSLFLLILLIVSFYNLQPGIDQIRQISWAKSLNDSQYFLDFNLVKSKGLIYYDKNNFFHNLFKTTYFDIGHLFNLVPILGLYLLNIIFNNEVLTFNITSIFFSVLNLIVSYLICKKLFYKDLKVSKYYVFDLLLFFNLIPVYLILYSPLGIHNISVFFLLITFFIRIDNKEKINIFYIVLISLLGIFSHKINAVLIPLFITMSFISDKKFNLLFKYCLSIIIILSPVVLLIFIFPEILTSTKQFSNGDNNLNLLIRLSLWFKNIINTLGYITLFFFLYGLIQFTIKEKFNYFNILIMIHILLYVVINSFSYYYLRTNLYITHTILILSFYGFVKLLTFQKYYFKMIFIFLFLLNISLNIFQLLNNNLPNNKLIQKYEIYYKNDKLISSSLNKIKANIKENNLILFYDNRIEDYFYVYQEKLFKNYSVNFRPLKNLVNLNYDLDKKALYDLFNSNVVLLSMSSNKNEIIDYFNKFIKKYDLHPKCKFTLENILFFENIESRGENMYLDKIQCSNY